MKVKNGARVALYLRCSTDGQKNSIEDQKRYVGATVSKYNLHVVNEYIDEGESGATIVSRPALQNLLRDAKAGQFDYTLVYDASRLSRGGNGPFWTLVEQHKAAGVLIYCCKSEAFITEDLGNDFSAEAGAARKHNVSMSHDVLRSMIVNITERKADPGRVAPYGYDRAYCNKEGQLIEIVRKMEDGSRIVLNPHTQENHSTIAPGESRPKQSDLQAKLVLSTEKRVKVVQLIFRLAMSMGYRKIANHLNNLGLKSPTGKKWSASSIRDILMNPVYAGNIAYNRRQKSRYHCIRNGQIVRHDFMDEGKLNTNTNDPEDWIVVEAAYDAIIPLGEFQSVQRAIQTRTHIGTLRSKNHIYLLSGLVFCSRCGQSMQGHTVISGKKQNKKRYTYYRCSSVRKHGRDQCTSISVLAEPLEAFVLDQLKGYMMSEQALQAIEGGMRYHLTLRNSHSGNVDQLKAQLNRYRQLEARLLANAGTDEVDALADSLTSIAMQKQDLQRKIDSFKPVISDDEIELKILAGLRYYTKKMQSLQSIESEATREALRALGVHVVFDPDRKEGQLYLDSFHCAAS